MLRMKGRNRGGGRPGTGMKNYMIFILFISSPEENDADEGPEAGGDPAGDGHEELHDFHSFHFFPGVKCRG